MNYIDTHTHIYLEHFDNDRAEVINRCLSAGVNLLLLPDIDSTTRNRMLAVCSEFSDLCFPMLGIHPTSVKQNYKEELEILKKHLAITKAYAIGECGLDYYWDKTFINEQKEVLEEHFFLAHQYRLPLVIHSRKSLEDIIALLKKHKNLNLTGVFHCYPGGINEARYLTEQGFYLGIGGVVTYKNSTLTEVVKAIPLQHLLLETDSPYLPPVPYRGKRNESSYIVEIAQKIAEIKQISLEEVAEVTTTQAKKLFNLE